MPLVKLDEHPNLKNTYLYYLTSEDQGKFTYWSRLS